MAQTRSAGWFGNRLLSGARGENDAIDPTQTICRHLLNTYSVRKCLWP
jgi:hypothetical protein